MTSLSVRFPDDLLEQVRELSREENRSVNGTVNEAVQRYVRQQRARHKRDAADR